MQKYTFKSQFATNFEHIKPKNNCPTILYLHGFCSNAWGRKPEAVKEVCLQKGLGMLRFDFAGHGSDAENFVRTDMEIWQNQVFEVIENVIRGDVIMVGSSMGGWLAMTTAIKYPQRVKGLVGLAAAPNFVKRFMTVVTDEQKQQLEKKGSFQIVNNDFTYTITARFVTSALAACLSENDPWPIKCPTVLLQGMKDASVPWHEALRYAEKIATDDVIVKLLKKSNHRLNDDEAVAEIKSTIATICHLLGKPR